MNKDRILEILESAKDKNDDVPMSLVRKAFEKLPSAEPEILACGSGELVQEPDGLVKDLVNDCVNRQDAIDMIMGQPSEAHYPSWYAEQIKALPSAQPDLQQTCNKLAKDINVPCKDTISRQDAIDAVSDGMCSGWDCDVIDKLKTVPSAQPERKTGHWIYYDEFDGAVTHTCSECGKRMTTAIGVKASFCWNCGSYNGGEQD